MIQTIACPHCDHTETCEVFRKGAEVIYADLEAVRERLLDHFAKAGHPSPVQVPNA